MTCMTNARVDAHIDGLPEWQQAISREVRNLVHAAGPHVVEMVMRPVASKRGVEVSRSAVHTSQQCSDARDLGEAFSAPKRDCSLRREGTSTVMKVDNPWRQEATFP